MRIDVIYATGSGGDEGDESAQLEAFSDVARPETELRVVRPEGAPGSITGVFDDAIATVPVLRACAQSAANGADALIVYCTADTGVQAAREMVSIPVIGVSEASFHLTAQLANRFSVLTFAQRIAPRFRAMASNWGMSDALVSVRSVDIPLAKFDDSASLLADALIDSARAAIEKDGAEAIILGCTDFERKAKLVEDRLEAEGLVCPLVCPFAVGVSQAEMLVSSGLSHSKLSYPLPDDFSNRNLIGWHPRLAP